MHGAGLLMKKLLLVSMLFLATGTMYGQSAATPTPAPGAVEYVQCTGTKADGQQCTKALDKSSGKTTCPRHDPNRVTCDGKTSKGTSCQNSPLKDKSRCRHHLFTD